MEKLKEIVCNIKNNWKSITIVVGMISIVTFVLAMTNIVSENRVKGDAVLKWYEQLPEEHGIKTNTDFVHQLQMMDLMQFSTGTAESLLELFSQGIQQEADFLGEFVGKCMENEIDRVKGGYSLVATDTQKVVKRLNVKVAESKKIDFYYDKIKLIIDINADDFFSEIEKMVKKEKLTIANKLVYSYVDDPSIAVIRYGEIVGVKKGETTLHLFCNGFHFEYPIKVKK